MNYIRIITFGEFEEIADKYNLIFPEKYWEISDSTLGIIKDKTFYEIGGIEHEINVPYIKK